MNTMRILAIIIAVILTVMLEDYAGPLTWYAYGAWMLIWVPIIGLLGEEE